MPNKSISSKGFVSLSGMVPTGTDHGAYDLISGCGEFEGWGIPPGSAISSLVAEARLRLLLDTVEAAAEGVSVATYADNIIILAPSTAAAEACRSALHDFALAEFGADEARILRTRTETVSKSKGFRFLKRDLRIYKKKLLVRLPVDRREMYLLKLALAVFPDGISDKQIVRRLRAWMAAHKGDRNVQSAAKAFAKDWKLDLQTHPHLTPTVRKSPS